MYRIYTGANGYYVAWERKDGFHHQPYDQGARLGFDRAAAEREYTKLEVRRYIEHVTKRPQRDA